MLSTTPSFLNLTSNSKRFSFLTFLPSFAFDHPSSWLSKNTWNKTLGTPKSWPYTTSAFKILTSASLSISYVTLNLESQMSYLSLPSTCKSWRRIFLITMSPSKPFLTTVPCSLQFIETLSKQ